MKPSIKDIYKTAKNAHIVTFHQLKVAAKL